MRCQQQVPCLLHSEAVVLQHLAGKYNVLIMIKLTLDLRIMLEL